MPVILVKWIMAFRGSGVPRWRRWCRGARRLGPGEFLVAGVVDGLGQELLGLGEEAGRGVQPDGGVAGLVGGVEPGELAGRLGDLERISDDRRGPVFRRVVTWCDWRTRLTLGAPIHKRWWPAILAAAC